MSQRTYLIAYDISCPKRWRKVFILLKSYGSPVQLSLFECRLNRKQHQALLTKLNKLIHQDEDKVHIYPICSACEQHIVVLGNGSRPEPLPVVWIVSDAA